MALPHITPRRVAPSILSGASGIHMLVRMSRWGRFSARTLSLRHFFRKHSHFILGWSSGPAVIWHRAKHYRQRRIGSSPMVRAAMAPIQAAVHALLEADRGGVTRPKACAKTCWRTRRRSGHSCAKTALSRPGTLWVNAAEQASDRRFCGGRAVLARTAPMGIGLSSAS